MARSFRPKCSAQGALVDSDVRETSAYPIFVTSKGRPHATTFDTLDNSGLQFTVVVEPQDAEAYADAIDHEDLMLLPENDRGLAYARQHVLDHCREQPETALQWFWMLDDDISGFYRTNPATKRNERYKAAAILGEAEECARALDGGNLGIVALEYQQFAWNATPGKPTMNSYTDVATLISPQVIADYRQELPLKVDRDFTLQVLATGYDTARLRWLSFSVPTNGTNEGGLHDTYDSLIEHDGEQIRREEYASRRLAELWPGIVEFKRKPNGRPDAKIHWRRTRG